MSKKKTKRIIKKNKNLPKECYFCKEVKNPSIKEIGNLEKFLSERGKITPRSRSGLCVKHQKRLTIVIKHARHLALLPFIVKV